LANDINIKFPLLALLTGLRAEGFDIGTATILDIQRMVANLYNDAVDKPEDLKFMLAPIICRNKEEQEKFYRLFNGYLQSTAERFLSTPTIPCKPWIKKYGVWLLLPLLLVAFLFYKYAGRPVAKPAITLGIVALNNRSFNVITDTISLMVKYADSIAAKNYKTNWQVSGPANTIRRFDSTQQIKTILDSAGLYSVYASTYNNGFLLTIDTTTVSVLCEVPPILSITGSAADSARGIFKAAINGKTPGKGYSYHWRVNGIPDTGNATLRTSLLQPNLPNTISLVVDWPGKNLHCSSDSLNASLELQPPFQLLVSPMANTPLISSQSYNWNNIWMSLIGLLFLPIAFGTLVWHLLKKPKPLPVEPANLPTDKTESEGPFIIEFNNHQDTILPEAGISQLAEVLRKRHTSEQLQLSMPKTIRSTIRKGGFPVLEYVPRTRATDFLVLFDKEFPDGHLAMLFGWVMERLKKEQVNLTIYTFSREPLLLSNQPLNHRLLPIDKIARLYPDTMLLICSQADGFFKSYDVVLKDWIAEKFKAWDTKIILTPLAKKDWGAKEMLLYSEGFTVVPADVNAHNIISNEINQLIDRQKLKKEIVPETYGTRQFNFNRWKQLSAFLSGALHDNELSFNQKADAYLVEQWLCALAVYPHINWQVTIAVGQAFENAFSHGGKLVNYSNLLVLSRIQWMNDGQLMDSLRLEMLNHLEPSKEALARQVIVGLMKEIAPQMQDNSLVKNEFDFLQNTNKVLVNAHNKNQQSITGKEWEQFKAYVNNDQLDWTTENYLQSGRQTPLVDHNSSSLKSMPLDKFIAQKTMDVKADPLPEAPRPKTDWTKLLRKWAPAATFVIVLLAGYGWLQSSQRLRYVNQNNFVSIIFQTDSASSKTTIINNLSVNLGSQFLQATNTGNNTYVINNVPLSDSAPQAVVQVGLSTGNVSANIVLNQAKYLLNIQQKNIEQDMDTAVGDVVLPPELNEIWSFSPNGGKTQFQLAFYLKPGLIFLRSNILSKSISSADVSKSKIVEAGPTGNGSIKIIAQDNGKFKIVYLRNVQPFSAGFYFCPNNNTEYSTLAEARFIKSASCQTLVQLAPLYQTSANKNPDQVIIQFPQNNTNLVPIEAVKLKAVLVRYNALSVADRGKVTVSISLNGFFKFDRDVQQRQQAIRSTQTMGNFGRARWQYKPFSGNAFQRDYITISFTGSLISNPAPDCSQTFLLSEAMAVKPVVVCKLNLSNLNLSNLPKEIYSFINLQQLTITGNNINDRDLKTFTKRFPKCQVINNSKNPEPTQNKALDPVIKAALGEVNKNAKN